METASRSVVYLLVRKEGHVFAGSASVVAGSAETEGHHNRLLTAGHLTASQEPMDIAVLGSDGRFLGEAKPVTLESETHSDVSVLAMTSTTDGAGYDAIPGLRLATDRQRALLVGDLDKPGGGLPGLSGAPILDADGNVRGIVTRLVDDKTGTMGQITVRVGQAEAKMRAGIPVTAGVAMPVRNVAFGTTLFDTGVAQALGAAGTGLLQSGLIKAKGRMATGNVVGFPDGACVAYRAEFAPYQHFDVGAERWSVGQAE